MSETNEQLAQPAQSAQPEPTLAERKVIYRARRGLKELDLYFDPYVREQYLRADAAEKALFAELIEQEDPDLLDWFMGATPAPTEALQQMVQRLKNLKHS